MRGLRGGLDRGGGSASDDVVVTRRHLLQALLWLHVLLIGFPFGEFVLRGVTQGHEGFESLGWITFLVAFAAASLLLMLAASGIVIPLVIADTLLGIYLVTQGSTVVVLFGFGFLLVAVIGAVLQGLVIRDWMAGRKAGM